MSGESLGFAVAISRDAIAIANLLNSPIHNTRTTMEQQRRQTSLQWTTEALSLPSKYLNFYGDFVTKNASSVGQIEGALRSLTYIIPGTFMQYELYLMSTDEGQGVSEMQRSLPNLVCQLYTHLRSLI